MTKFTREYLPSLSDHFGVYMFGLPCAEKIVDRNRHLAQKFRFWGDFLPNISGTYAQKVIGTQGR